MGENAGASDSGDVLAEWQQLPTNGAVQRGGQRGATEANAVWGKARCAQL
jgi:hypothetical protein